MAETKYLIVGSSHAGLEALHAIRAYDAEGSLVMATRDSHLPYSPTILPYVVSGRSSPEKIKLRDEAYFKNLKVEFAREAQLAKLDVKKKLATFADGRAWSYEKLLLATGAKPIVPPIKGLDQVSYHVMRSMDDALGLRQAMGKAKTAVVLGAGLIGTHGAENLAEAGLKVTVIEMQGQVLPGYFDQDGAAIIERAFTKHGIELIFGHGAAEVKPGAVILDDGREIPFDLLLVGTGVRPETGFLAGSGVEVNRGILVDEAMRASAADVWAAGDCAEAKLFQAEGKGVAGILPMAVEQGRIAGMGMAGDRAAKAFLGSVSINTYTFYGQQAISVGAGIAGPAPEGAENLITSDPAKNVYRRIVLKDGRLMGAVGINVALDPGILWQLILRKVDLTPVREAFLADPLATGRSIMSRMWR
jgi:phenylglyoxylate dehydrogenase epsilon subunit